jgi:hypothetical protein
MISKILAFLAQTTACFNKNLTITLGFFYIKAPIFLPKIGKNHGKL